jgi:hypothetical protein
VSELRQQLATAREELADAITRWAPNAYSHANAVLYLVRLLVHGTSSSCDQENELGCCVKARNISTLSVWEPKLPLSGHELWYQLATAREEVAHTISRWASIIVYGQFAIRHCTAVLGLCWYMVTGSSCKVACNAALPSNFLK